MVSVGSSAAPFAIKVRAFGQASSSCAMSMPRPTNIVCCEPLLTRPLKVTRPETPVTWGTAASFARKASL